MEYIRVLLYDLPEAIKGFTVYYFDDDGMAYYTMFINAKFQIKNKREQKMLPIRFTLNFYLNFGLYFPSI